MIYALVSVLFVLTSFICVQSWGDGIRVPKEAFSIISMSLVSVVGLISYNMKKSRNITFLSCFFVWCVFITFFNGIRIPLFVSETAAINFPSQFFAWKELFYILLTLVTVYVISSFQEEDRAVSLFGYRLELRKLRPIEYTGVMANTTVLILILMCVYSIMQYAGLDSFFKATNNLGDIARTNTDSRYAVAHRVVGTIGNPTLFASFLAICFPMTLYKRNVFYYLARGLCFTAIVLSDSATALVALTVATLFYYLLTNKILFIVLLTVILAVSFFAVSTDMVKLDKAFNPTGRIEAHKEAFRYLSNNPLFGIGLGTFEYVVGNIPDSVKHLKGERWKELHDEYGQVAFSVGIIGLFIILCMCFMLFALMFNNFSFESSVFLSCLVSFMLVSLTQFPMRIAPLSLAGVFYLGLYLRTIRRDV